MVYNERNMRRLLLITLLVLVSISSVAAKDWRGILPLHSTREHVEALLGPPPPPPENRIYTLHKGRSIYYLDEGEVYIVFADEEFLVSNNCPSVVAGTVLSIRITPKVRWNAGYQFYNYEQQSNPFGFFQNFRANTGYTSVLWSF